METNAVDLSLTHLSAGNIIILHVILEAGTCRLTLLNWRSVSMYLLEMDEFERVVWQYQNGAHLEINS